MIHWSNILAIIRKVINTYTQKNPRAARIMNIIWYAVIIIGLLPLLLVIFKRKDPSSEDAQRNTSSGQSTQQQNRSSSGKSSGLFGKVCLNAKAFLLDHELYENRSTNQQQESIMEIASSTTETDDANDERMKHLKKLANDCDVYIIVQVASDEEQNYYQDLLEKKYGFFNSVKILFCETVKGKIAFCRQINPQLCIDVDKETTRELKRFYEGVCMIQKNAKNSKNEHDILEYSNFLDLMSHLTKA
ncbi:hypothetical protein C9374_002868 [Naegleria lovaniensis]|uniref:Uncharacterized protein n=1 Tax=Naegleria lovaniensis TaxID=51637 RepID=A0AA88GPE4_NAELO|nr:Peroxin 22 (Pex22), putative [Naegleria lovaniensis]KAG2386422.1 hypothetical protein C9374_002868 [Naegleria lovaniensis]